ncbi:MAG: outer membrane beta-barrel protein [Bacteroidota bacterium]
MKLFRSVMILAVIIALTTVQLNAQNKIGIRSGWNYASISDDGNRFGNHLNSFYVGLFKEHKIIPMFHFGYGLEYLQNGYEVKRAYTHKLNYISVPLYLKFKLGPAFITAGTGLNFMVSDNIDVSVASVDTPDGTVNTFDMPLQVGAGVKILMFTIDFRYHWGMFDVIDGLGYNNQYMQVGLGFSI